jgi:hypothetical protein
MTSSRATLLDFFTGGGKELTFAPHLEIEESASVARVKEVLTAKVPALRWTAAKTEILDKLSALLKVDLATVMCGAWKKYPKLLDYADPEKCPPDRTYLVPLAEHVIKSAHRPSLEILLAGELVGKIEVRLEISLALKGFILEIQGGRIKAIHTGDCQGAGAVKCEDLVLVEEKSETFHLPDLIDLGEGIQIR